jgi:hypothetical protein
MAKQYREDVLEGVSEQFGGPNALDLDRRDHVRAATVIEGDEGLAQMLELEPQRRPVVGEPVVVRLVFARPGVVAVVEKVFDVPKAQQEVSSLGLPAGRRAICRPGPRNPSNDQHHGGDA